MTRAVARLRREFAAERDEAFMDLVWHPGEAQADFGEVDVLLRGVVQRMHHFVLDFCSSGWAVCRSGSCSITPPAWAIRGTGSASRA